MSVAEANEQNARRGGKSASAFRTISEVATELDVPPHVLRFWESKFPQIKPLKRGGGRRYYRPEDVDLLRRIRELLYRDGYTIKGVQKLLKNGDKAQFDAEDMQSTASTPIEPPPPRAARSAVREPTLPNLALAPAAAVVLDANARMLLDEVLGELDDIRSELLQAIGDE